MSRLRTTYWYLSIYARKHAKTIIGALIGGIAIFAGLLPLLTNLPQVKPTKYIGVIGNYDFSTLPRPIQNQISLGLTRIEEDGSVTPELAERWSIEDDGRTYRFILKTGNRWQDGKPLETGDISFNFQDTEIITTNHEILFKLAEPFSPFPVVVSQPLFRETQVSYFRFWKRTKIIGLGNYEVRQTKYQDNRLSELVLDGASDRLIYRFYLTEERALTAFKHGQIDTVMELSDSKQFENWPNINVSPRINYDRYAAIFFNHESVLFEKNIRQALSYATRKPNESLRAKGPIAPTSWAYLDSVKTYPYDLDQATERILSSVPQQPLNITLLTTPRFQSMADQVKQDWEEFGARAYDACRGSSAVTDKANCENVRITVNVQVSNFPDTSNYQALLIGQQIPPDPDQYSLWHSTQNTNFTHYKNPRIDALLENGRKTSDQTERRAIYQEFQQFLLEDAPAVFIQYLESYNISRK